MTKLCACIVVTGQMKHFGTLPSAHDVLTFRRQLQTSMRRGGGGALDNGAAKRVLAATWPNEYKSNKMLGGPRAIAPAQDLAAPQRSPSRYSEGPEKLRGSTRHL